MATRNRAQPSRGAKHDIFYASPPAGVKRTAAFAPSP